MASLSKILYMVPSLHNIYYTIPTLTNFSQPKFHFQTSPTFCGLIQLHFIEDEAVVWDGARVELTAEDQLTPWTSARRPLEPGAAALVVALDEDVPAESQRGVQRDTDLLHAICYRTEVEKKKEVKIWKWGQKEVQLRIIRGQNEVK